MQHIKNLTSGIKKNDQGSTNEKDYDLDRRRDSKQLMELNSLNQDKIISMFDTDELDLFQNVEVE